MNEIKTLGLVEFSPDGKMEISGRQLHMKLNVATRYDMWMSRMIEYGFIEGTDFCTKLCESTGGRPSTDHIITLSMAKEIAMLQRTKEGQEIRRYLIQIEEDWNSPDKVMARALLMADNKIKVLEAKVEADAPKVAYAEFSMSSKDAVLIRDFCHALPKEGIKMGERQLYAWLVERKFLKKKSDGSYDVYQRYANQGLFERQPRTIAIAGKAAQTRYTVKITTKGQMWLLDKLKKWQSGQDAQMELALDM